MGVGRTVVVLGDHPSKDAISPTRKKVNDTVINPSLGVGCLKDFGVVSPLRFNGIVILSLGCYCI